jgi:competence protein ComEC
MDAERPISPPPWLAPGHALLALVAALLVQQLPALPLPATGLLLLAFALLGAPVAERPAARALVVVVLAAGWTLWHAERALASRIDGSLEGRTLVVEGRVDGLPDRSSERIVFDLVDARTLADTGPQRLHGRLRIALYQPAAQPLARDIVAGARVRAELRLRRPRGLLNPGGFDAERHALERRIAASGHVRTLIEVDRSVAGPVDRARQAVVDWIASGQGTGRTAAVLRALAVGDQAPLDEDDWDVFRATGTSHLIAISGFHIGLVAGFVAWLAGWVWRGLPVLALSWPRQRVQAACALAGAFGYSLLAGMSAPVLRTLVMIAVVAIAAMGRRPLGPAQGLGVAAMVALALDPLAVLNAGFWLSFAGVAWLIWCLGGRPRAGLALEFGRAQVAATLGLAPIGIALFQQFSVVGPLANVVAIPWISLVVVPLLLAAILALPLSAALAGGLLSLSAHACDALLAVLDPVARWPWAEIWLAAPPPWALLLALVGAALVLMPRGVPGRWLGFALMLPAFVGPSRALPPDVIEVWMFDVGQGQAVLVRDRSHAILVDTGASRGGYSSARAVVLPALRALGVRRLDTLVLSHGDNDHAGGAAVIEAAFPGVAVLAGSDVRDRPHCVAGTRWSAGAYSIEVLHPPAHFPALRNDSACVLRVDAPGGSVLLPGDISTLIERRLLRDGARLAADVVALPHHGSRSSSDPAFVAAVGARLALASAGWRNRFGHPHAEVVARWRGQGARVLDTGGSGAMVVRLVPGQAPEVRIWRSEARRYWHEPLAEP